MGLIMDMNVQLLIMLAEQGNEEAKKLLIELGLLSPLANAA